MNTTERMNIHVNGCRFSENIIQIPTDDIAEKHLTDDLSYLVAVCAVPLIIALGAFGNVAFLWMVYRLPYMRTNVNVYLVSLAIVDLLYILTVPPIFIYVILSSPVRNDFPFSGEYSCLMFFYFGYLCYYLSIALLTVISFERYIAICHPIHHIKTQGKSRIRNSISIAGIVAVILASVTLLRRGQLVEHCLAWPEDERYIDMPTIMRTCEPLGGNDKVIISLTELLYVGFFFVALLISGFCYTKIVIVLSHRPDADNGSGTRNKQAAHNIMVRNQVTRALVTLGLVYFITQTPIRICDINDLVLQFGPGFLTEDQASLIESIGFCLLFLNSAVNSYIYVFCSSCYRRAFVEAFSRSSNMSKTGSPGSTESRHIYLKPLKINY